MLRLIFYLSLALTLAVPVSNVYSQTHFSTCLDGAGNVFNATIVIPSTSRPTINGAHLKNDSEVAVFATNPGFSDLCVGVATISDESGAITIWGDDLLSPEKDGLHLNEAFVFKIWDSELDFEYPAYAVVSSIPMAKRFYSNDQTFVLSELSAYWSFSGLAVRDDDRIIAEDSTVVINVLENDSGAEGDLLSLLGLGQPSNGVASITSDGRIEYDPHPHFHGPDSLTYIVAGSTGSRGKGMLRIQVASVNDKPVVISSPPLKVSTGSTYYFDIVGFDVEGELIQFYSESLPAWLSLTDDGVRIANIFGIPGPENVGDHDIRIGLSDGTDSTIVAYTLSVQVPGDQTATDVDDAPTTDASSLPEAVELSQNYPNPFNPETTILFNLPSSMHVELDIFDLLGQHVQTLVDGIMRAGSHRVRWSAGQLPSGVYLYRLRAGNSVLSKTLSLIK